MIPSLLVFVVIIGLFFLLLAAKSFTGKRFCVVCASVGLTWLTFLVLYRLGYFQDEVLLALLMGQSILGLYYLAERNVGEKLHLFRLPFLLSLTLIAHVAISPSWQVLQVIWLLLVLWVAFVGVYVSRKVPGVRQFVENVIKCCRDW